VNISDFQQHELNANVYDPAGFELLVEDVRREGGPCTLVEVVVRPHGGIVVLSGNHNVEACKKAGIVSVPREAIRVLTPKDEVDELHVLHSRNRHGRVDKVKRSAMFAKCRDVHGLSIRKLAERMNEPQATVQQLLALHELAATVYPIYRGRVGRLSATAVGAISTARATNGTRSSLVLAAASPVEFLNEAKAAKALIASATVRWDTSPLSGSEVAKLVAAMKDGVNEEGIVAALTNLLETRKPQRGRPKRARKATAATVSASPAAKGKDAPGGENASGGGDGSGGGCEQAKDDGGEPAAVLAVPPDEAARRLVDAVVDHVVGATERVRGIALDAGTRTMLAKEARLRLKKAVSGFLAAIRQVTGK